MKLKRVLAIVGVAILVLMYLLTLIFSLMHGQVAADLFKASVYCTLIIPIFLYLYTMVYGYLKKRGEEIRKEAMPEDSTDSSTIDMKKSESEKEK